MKKPGFTDSAFGPFTNHRERIQSFREIGNLKHLCRSELDKVCFAHDATYFDSKDLDKKTGSRASVDEQLAEELHRPVTKKWKEEKSMRDLKTIFGQQI